MFRKKFKTTADAYKEKLKGLRQTFAGDELPDPTPMAPPIGYKKQPSMVEHIRTMIRSERLRQEAEAAGAESFDEADDFDVEDDDFPPSPYEFDHLFEPPTSIDHPPKAEGGGEGGGSPEPPPPPPPKSGEAPAGSSA